MRYGLMIFPTDQTMQPVELGREAEERGFESLWFPEHSHIPTSRVSPWGGRVGAPPLPDFYWRTHDQFLALAAVAATTTTLNLGTGITSTTSRVVGSSSGSDTAGTRRNSPITASSTATDATAYASRSWP
jgi:alkanesulfonate monooxygenase SsuD/methylene tetrahydromethanopterin reductase-like flavin-dependent oxidoreductase (luciferase family)